jgi:hypothetical protein
MLWTAMKTKITEEIHPVRIELKEDGKSFLKLPSKLEKETQKEEKTNSKYLKLIFKLLLVYFELTTTNKIIERLNNDEERTSYSVEKFKETNTLLLENLVHLYKFHKKNEDLLFYKFSTLSLYTDTFYEFDLDSLFEDPIYLPNNLVIPQHTRSSFVALTPYNEFLLLYSYFINSIIQLFSISPVNTSHIYVNYAEEFHYKYGINENLIELTPDELEILREVFYSLNHILPYKDPLYLEAYEIISRILDNISYSSSQFSSQNEIDFLIDYSDFWEFLCIYHYLESLTVNKEIIAVDIFGDFYYKKNTFDWTYSCNSLKLHFKPDLVIYDKNGNTLEIIDFKFKVVENISNRDIIKQVIYFYLAKNGYKNLSIKNIKLKFIVLGKQDKSTLQNSINLKAPSIEIKKESFWELAKKIENVSSNKIKDNFENLKRSLTKRKRENSNNLLSTKDIYDLCLSLSKNSNFCEEFESYNLFKIEKIQEGRIDVKERENIKRALKCLSNLLD